MGVFWAIATTILWAFLAVAFGRSKSDLKLTTMLILGAVIAMVLSAHAYTEGWKGGSKATVSSRRTPTPERGEDDDLRKVAIGQVIRNPATPPDPSPFAICGVNGLGCTRSCQPRQPLIR